MLKVFFKNILFLMLYSSAPSKAIATFFISGDTEYFSVRFEYKTASEEYLVAEIFWINSKKYRFSIH